MTTDEKIQALELSCEGPERIFKLLESRQDRHAEVILDIANRGLPEGVSVVVPIEKPPSPQVSVSANANEVNCTCQSVAGDADTKIINPVCPRHGWVKTDDLLPPGITR